jgi:hypothetical protein
MLIPASQAARARLLMAPRRAAIDAVRGDRIGALRAMRTAFARGWRLYGAWTLVDPMFAGVAQDTAVLALEERMRADVWGVRRRLGLSGAGESGLGR